jgi:hypothetical protein
MRNGQGQVAAGKVAGLLPSELMRDSVGLELKRICI